MDAKEVIEAYVADIVRLLSSRQRDDVAAELRSLLSEDLESRAKESGRAADEAMALSLVRGHGRPDEVAARYEPAWTIIDAADSKSFVRSAILGLISLIVLAAFRKRWPAASNSAEDFLKTGIPVWLGVLVMYFGAKSWIRRRRPEWASWKPRDRDRVNRVATAALIPIASLCIALYAAPAWAIDLVSGGRIETSWAVYTEELRVFRLPMFIGLLIGLTGLRSFAAIRGRWSRITRRIGIGLNMALAVLVGVLAAEGNIFPSSEVDRIARDVLGLVALIYVPCVGAMLYDEMGRIRTNFAPDPTHKDRRSTSAINGLEA